jgi:DNA-binding transcriptional ArsR family regulator
MVEDVTVISPKEFKKVFTDKKREILNSLYIEDYESISELAKDLERDYSIVNKDISKLEDVGLVQLEEEKGMKKPKLVNSEIMIDKFNVNSILPLHSNFNSELFNRNLLTNNTGIRMGEYEGKEVNINRWSPKTQNQITIGKIGSGKSYSSKLQLLREYVREDNLKVFLIDPLGGFRHLTRILDGETIRFDNLSDKSMSDIRNEIKTDGNDVTYFNLTNQQVSSKISPLMKIILDEIYREEKDSDYRCMVLLDTAHYVLNEGNLEIDMSGVIPVDEIASKSSESQISINFISQTIQEFLNTKEGKNIIENCSIKMLHRLSEMGYNERSTLNLNDEQAEYVRNAMPGNEDDGYSEALIGLEGEYIPVRVSPSEDEYNIMKLDGNEVFNKIIDKN